MKNTEKLKKRLESNKKGTAAGVYSVCSAHKTVLEASMLQAKADDSILIIESTSNQVNQYGGYTGMRACDFTAYINGIAASLGFPFEKIVLGGDHLGPNPWQNEKAENAMEKAEVLVSSCVDAGYKKIHLDASMLCLDDTGGGTKPLSDEITAERTARLCRASEAAAAGLEEKPLYIIGTEVPVPGGSREAEDYVKPTEAESVKKTIDAMRKAFVKRGLEAAWERVIALVVQPGVEFGDNRIFYYDREKAASLSRALDNSPLVYEAHSTDYQTGKCLKNMVEDHFCILKAGPALSFAYREALFSLAKIEKELAFKISSLSNLEKTMEKVMLEARPNYWEKYYRGTEGEKRLARKYSLSDRARYYWPQKELSGAAEKLMSNLSAGIPPSLISQFMPHLFMPVCEGAVENNPAGLAIAHIRYTLNLYAGACGF